jgi:hydrogenase/urease accessory protein HupE
VSQDQKEQEMETTETTKDATEASCEKRPAAAPRFAASLVALLGLLAAAAPYDVHAHQTKLSSSRLALEGQEVRAELELNGIDLNVAAQLALTDAADQVLPDRLEAQKDRVFGYVLERATLSVAGGAACEARPESIAAKGDHVVLTLKYRCPAADRPLSYRVVLFHEVDPAARHMVSVQARKSWIGLLGTGNPVLQIGGEPAGLGETVWRYFVSGVEHIAIGYDHIAFLLAVIVLARRFWPLFAVVTAFTVAHSITLSLAVLEVVTLPSRLVEAAIAGSIVYVAAENFFVSDIRRRWWITFAFGLVHGFGFASVLREYGIPRDAVVPALAAFNVGVEIGQLLIVGAATLLWKAGFALGRARGLQPTEPLQRKVGLGLSGAVLVLGLYWLVERVFATG